MKLITGLTDQPNQQSTIILPDGTGVTLMLNYVPQQAGWFYTVTWQGQAQPFEVDGVRLVSSPNILRIWRKLLTFGIAVVTVANVEPSGASTFIDGTTALYLLDADEVAEIEAAVFPGL